MIMGLNGGRARLFSLEKIIIKSSYSPIRVFKSKQSKQMQNSTDKNDENFRRHLVDVAIEFLNNSKISNEDPQRKREFLKKKGLTDTEINYAFSLVPEKQRTPSTNRFAYGNIVFSGVLLASWNFFNRILIEENGEQLDQLNSTVKDLENCLNDMKKVVARLMN